MSAYPQILLFEPVFQTKIWGGNALQTLTPYKNIPPQTGEMWAISAHVHGTSTVLTEPFTGMSLKELYDAEPALFGNINTDEFPLLIKILDAQEDLSIQVHPNDAFAKEHEQGSLGKQECWYVLDAKPGATIIVGQKVRNPQEFSKKAHEGNWSEILNEIPVRIGDFFQINPGCVHAIKAGTQILEIQQSSDITYRVYDYDRVDESGAKRPLHLDKALQVIDFTREAPQCAIHPQVKKQQIVNLVCCESYCVDIAWVGGTLTIENTHPFVCVSVITGAGTVCGIELVQGVHGLIPANTKHIHLEGDMQVVLSYLP